MRGVSNFTHTKCYCGMINKIKKGRGYFDQSLFHHFTLHFKLTNKPPKAKKLLKKREREREKVRYY